MSGHEPAVPHVDRIFDVNSPKVLDKIIETFRGFFESEESLRAALNTFEDDLQKSFFVIKVKGYLSNATRNTIFTPFKTKGWHTAVAHVDKETNLIIISRGDVGEDVTVTRVKNEDDGIKVTQIDIGSFFENIDYIAK